MILSFKSKSDIFIFDKCVSIETFIQETFIDTTRNVLGPCLLRAQIVESDTPVFSLGLGIESIMTS